MIDLKTTRKKIAEKSRKGLTTYGYYLDGVKIAEESVYKDFVKSEGSRIRDRTATVRDLTWDIFSILDAFPEKREAAMQLSNVYTIIAKDPKVKYFVDRGLRELFEP